MSATIDVTVNGQVHSVEPGATIGDFLDGQGIDPAVVVVELNRSIVKKENFSTTPLNNEDTVELLRFVGGG